MRRNLLLAAVVLAACQAPETNEQMAARMRAESDSAKAAIVGCDSIRAWLTANGMPPGATLAFTAVDVAANGPMAAERGTYAFSMPAQGRTPAMSMTGKYLSHWHKVNGSWVLAAEIWSDDVPAGSGGN